MVTHGQRKNKPMIGINNIINSIPVQKRSLKGRIFIKCLGTGMRHRSPLTEIPGVGLCIKHLSYVMLSGFSSGNSNVSSSDSNSDIDSNSKHVSKNSDSGPVTVDLKDGTGDHALILRAPQLKDNDRVGISTILKGGEGSGIRGHHTERFSDVKDWKFPSSSEDPAPGGKYFYHTTPVSKLESISSEGIKPGTMAPISLAPHLESANYWGSATGRGESPALLRIERQYVSVARHDEEDMYDPRDETAEDATFRSIPAENLSVYADGKWEKLTSYKKSFVKGGPGSGIRGHHTEREQLSDSDKSNIDSWQWADSEPGGVSYDHLRNPKTSGGKSFTETLNKLPEYNGVMYRGLVLGDKDIAKLTSPKGMKLSLHSSSSLDEEVALSFMRNEASAASYDMKQIILEVHGSGRNINSFLAKDLQETKEIVMVAGTMYKFAGLERKSDYLKIKIKEAR